MKKRLLLILVVLSLYGCGNSDESSAFVGTWQDTWSKRASLTITCDESTQTYSAVADWAGSSAENTQWRMSGGTLESADCITFALCEQYAQVFAEDGTMREMLVEKSASSFTLKDEHLYWDSNTGESAETDFCIFEKIEPSEIYG